jgi:DNA-binding winged helix-turn-helix (wHTH) protein
VDNADKSKGHYQAQCFAFFHLLFFCFVKTTCSGHTYRYGKPLEIVLKTFGFSYDLLQILNSAIFGFHMNKTQYIVNHRFLVDPGLNYVLDQQTGKESRLEPRLMEVLTFLTGRVNQLVIREELVKEIWNDYGGGDEGLNQAISFLRKLLNDNNKEIIETIPKKGYIIHATITEKIIPIIKHGTKKIYQVAGLLCLVLIIVYFIYSGISATENPDSQIHHKTNNSVDLRVDSSIKKNPDKLENNANIPSPPGADVFRDTDIKKATHQSSTKKTYSDSASGADVQK